MFSIVLTTKLGVDHGVAHDTLGRTRGDSLIHPSNGEAGEPRAGLARHGGASLVAAHLIALEDSGGACVQCRTTPEQPSENMRKMTSITK